MTDISATSFFRQATAGTASQPPDFTFQHNEVQNGGTKYPTRAYLTAHHPETGEEVGKLQYFPPKRKGGPVTVDDLEGHHPGAASALMNEMEARHPGSRVAHANDMPISKEKKFYDHPDYGRATDWDTHHPNLPEQIHRGMGVQLDPSDARFINGGTGSAAEHAETLRQHLTSTGPLGMHWSSNEQISRNFSYRNIRDPRKEIPVVLHADRPDVKDIETRPSVLKNNGVWSHDYEHGDAEIPMRRGRQVSIRGISWKPDAHHPEADEHGWVHHTFDQGVQHKSSLTDFFRQATTHPGPGPDDYSRQDGEDEYAHRTRVNRGLSLGHLTTEQAEGTGGYQYQRSGWKPMPHTLYHTTTDAPGVMEHGLKAGHELGQRDGHGLGGTPQYLSLTDSAEHAHTMLNALHEYHDAITNKTTLADMAREAEHGGYHKEFMGVFGRDPHTIDSHLRDKYHDYRTLTDEEAGKEGLTPHPTAHERDEHGRGGKGWERDLTPREHSDRAHMAYGSFSRAREWYGDGPAAIMFSGNDREAFAKKDPSHFAVLKVHPKPGAQGFENRIEHEWRTGTGDAVQVHGEPLRRTSARIGQALRPFVVTAAHPRPELPPEQEDALSHPDFSEYRRRSLNLAKNPVPGTVMWRGEARHGEPEHSIHETGVGMHWSVNPDSTLVPSGGEGQRKTVWQARLEHPAEQAISRSHPMWNGNNGYSMDHEAEIRLHPGTKVHVEGAYVWHGDKDDSGPLVPRHPDRSHPDWKWHPIGQHAEVSNGGNINYSHHGIGGEEDPASDSKTPPPWTGAHARTVLEHEHALGNHYSKHPGGDLDDVDWDAPEHHWRAHSDAIGTDSVLSAGITHPHELNDDDTSEWLRWHPDRSGIEQRHGGQRTASATAPSSRYIYCLSSPTSLRAIAAVGPLGPEHPDAGSREEAAKATHTWPTIQHYLAEDRFHTSHPQHSYDSLEQAQDHAHQVAKDYGVSTPTVHISPHDGWSWADLHGGSIHLAHDRFDEHTLLHEIAHHVNYQIHGHEPDFFEADAHGDSYRRKYFGILAQHHSQAAHRPHETFGRHLGDVGHEMLMNASEWAARGVHPPDESPRPGFKDRMRQIFRRSSLDTPVPDNTAPYEHEHDWLPHSHFFAPAQGDLDPRLFDGDRIRPQVRRYLLGLLNDFWAPKYGNSWQSWARVYLAGSEASHFYGNGDLDILIGVDYEAARQHVDAFTGEPDGALGDRLTTELRHGLNDDRRMLPGPDGETGPYENTWFVIKSSTGDIREIHPYAAYDLTADDWAVRPVEVPGDFGPEKLPESSWDIVDSLRSLVKAISELPAGVREREGAALYDYLHTDRSAAFGNEGTGLYDPANTSWKALVDAPGEPLQQLVDWKHAHGVAATQEEVAA